MNIKEFIGNSIYKITFLPFLINEWINREHDIFIFFFFFFFFTKGNYFLEKK